MPKMPTRLDVTAGRLHLRPGESCNMNMSDWKILYRDQLDQDRTSQSIPSKEAALKQASDLYHQQRAELYRIEGPNGRALPKEEIMRWMSANMKSGHRISPDSD